MHIVSNRSINIMEPLTSWGSMTGGGEGMVGSEAMIEGRLSWCGCCWWCWVCLVSREEIGGTQQGEHSMQHPFPQNQTLLFNYSLFFVIGVIQGKHCTDQLRPFLSTPASKKQKKKGRKRPGTKNLQIFHSWENHWRWFSFGKSDAPRHKVLSLTFAPSRQAIREALNQITLWVS